MLVVRFKVQSKPDKSEQLRAAFEAVVGPSRTVEGVLGFDIALDVTDANTFIATEIFEDEAALARQESLPEVQNVMTLLPEVLAADPEATVYTVASAKPWGS